MVKVDIYSGLTFLDFYLLSLSLDLLVGLKILLFGCHNNLVLELKIRPKANNNQLVAMKEDFT